MTDRRSGADRRTTEGDVPGGAADRRATAHHYAAQAFLAEHGDEVDGLTILERRGGTYGVMYAGRHALISVQDSDPDRIRADATAALARAEDAALRARRLLALADVLAAERDIAAADARARRRERAAATRARNANPFGLVRSAADGEDHADGDSEEEGDGDGG